MVLYAMVTFFSASAQHKNAGTRFSLSALRMGPPSSPVLPIKWHCLLADEWVWLHTSVPHTHQRHCLLEQQHLDSQLDSDLLLSDSDSDLPKSQSCILQ